MDANIGRNSSHTFFFLKKNFNGCLAISHSFFYPFTFRTLRKLNTVEFPGFKISFSNTNKLYQIPKTKRRQLLRNVCGASRNLQRPFMLKTSIKYFTLSFTYFR